MLASLQVDDRCKGALHAALGAIGCIICTEASVDEDGAVHSGWM